MRCVLLIAVFAVGCDAAPCCDGARAEIVYRLEHPHPLEGVFVFIRTPGGVDEHYEATLPHERRFKAARRDVSVFIFAAFSVDWRYRASLFVDGELVAQQTESSGLTVLTVP